MLNLNSVIIGTQRIKEQAAFYEKVLGKPADMVNDTHSYYGWQVGACFLSILEHSAVEGLAKEPARVMINFETSQVKEEYERIKALGAEVVQEPYEVQIGWFATLADPDGNYFQLMTAMGG